MVATVPTSWHLVTCSAHVATSECSCDPSVILHQVINEQFLPRPSHYKCSLFYHHQAVFAPACNI